VKAIAVLLALLPGAAVAQCEVFPYYVEEIGTLGGTESRAVGLNNLGEVTGFARDTAGMYRAFVTDANLKLRAVDPGITTANFGRSVNDAGWVAGYVEGTSGAYGMVNNGAATAFLMNDLGGSDLFALSVNNNGVVAGYRRTPSGDARPFRTEVNLAIHSLPLAPYGSYAGAIGINDARQCVGYGDYFDGEYFVERAIRWEAGDSATVLGTLGGHHSYAYAINILGQVVGEAETSSGAYHAFRTRFGTLQMQDLGALEGVDSSANGINSAGDAVGASYVEQASTYVPQKAFVFLDDGPITVLDSLVDPSLGWTLREASAINDRGQIVGWGIRNGVTRGFRATPNTSVFPYGDVNADGEVNAADVALVLQVAGGLAARYDRLAADVAPAPACNGRGFGDGKVTIADASRIARRIAGLETKWP
jgi:probable HAF family extracellular repeat protein